MNINRNLFVEITNEQAFTVHGGNNATDVAVNATVFNSTDIDTNSTEAMGNVNASEILENTGLLNHTVAVNDSVLNETLLDNNSTETNATQPHEDL